MSWDEFWNDDVSKVKYYRKAYKIKKDIENEKLWLQGLYVYEAIADLSPILRTSLDGKSKRPHEYPKKPYALTVDAEKPNSQLRKMDSMKAKVYAWAVGINKQFANASKGVNENE